MTIILSALKRFISAPISVSLLCAIMVCSAQVAQAQTPPSPPASPSAPASPAAPEYKPGKKTVKLFNGKDLKGWYTFLKGRGRDNDPLKVFTVHDGLLHISGEEWGCITTGREYENYKLVVEFKWLGGTHPPRTNNARDSGILLHSQGKDGGYDGTWMNSIECQIIEGGTGDFIVVGNGTDQFSITSPVAAEKHGGSFVYQPGGEEATIKGGRINWYGRDPAWQDVIDFRGQNDVERPVGEWNTMECHAYGDEIKVYLNGTLVNFAKNVRPMSGKIQIQSEAAEIAFRKIELTPLELGVRHIRH